MNWFRHAMLFQIALLLGGGSAAFAQEAKKETKQEAKQEIKLLINSPDEPIVKGVSFDKTASFLDHQSVAWTQVRKCGTCHTNYPYLLARGQLGGDLKALKEV